jgi:hypothetical protein
VATTKIDTLSSIKSDRVLVVRPPHPHGSLRLVTRTASVGYLILAHTMAIGFSAPSTSASVSAPAKVVLPDLVSHCEFKLRLNPNVHTATTTSERWILDGAKLSQKKMCDFHGLKAGLLTCLCYPDANLEQLRVCCDFMYYLFHL